MRGVKWIWKDSNEPGTGLIAQELEKIDSELISINSGGFLSIKYNNIIAYLIESIKCQQQQINELKHKVKDL